MKHRAPKHRADVWPIVHSATGTVVLDPANEARCTCRVSGWATCPRHNPTTYADQQARHATDSIMGPADMGRGFW